MPSCGIKQCRLPYTRNFEIFEISSSLTASIWLYGQNNWQKNTRRFNFIINNKLFIYCSSGNGSKKILVTTKDYSSFPTPFDFWFFNRSYKISYALSIEVEHSFRAWNNVKEYKLGEIQWFGISWAADPCWSGTMWFQ